MKTYTIRQISEMFGLPASALRYYEDMGLLENVIHTENKQRLYTDGHIARLKAILCFKRTGLPIAKMHDFFEYEKNLPDNIDSIVALVKEQEESVCLQLEKMQEDLKHIRHKVRYYTGIKEALENGTKWPSWDES